MNQTVVGLKSLVSQTIPVRWQYRIEEAAQLMGVCKPTLQQMIKDGSIVGVHSDDGKIRHVEAQSMLAYIRERQTTNDDAEAGQ